MSVSLGQSYIYGSKYTHFTAVIGYTLGHFLFVFYFIITLSIISVHYPLDPAFCVHRRLRPEITQLELIRTNPATFGPKLPQPVVMGQGKPLYRTRDTTSPDKNLYDPGIQLVRSEQLYRITGLHHSHLAISI